MLRESECCILDANSTARTNCREGCTMIWYDSDPSFCGPPLAKYEGTKYDRDNTTFRSFDAAKHFARKRLLDELALVKASLEELEAITVQNCKMVRNPFW